MGNTENEAGTKRIDCFGWWVCAAVGGIANPIISSSKAVGEMAGTMLHSRLECVVLGDNLGLFSPSSLTKSKSLSNV